MFTNITVYRYTTIVMLILFLSFCKKETISDKTIDYSYLRNNTGSWIEYDVTEINIDTQSDTFNYKIREVIESTFIDANGNEILRIERYMKTIDSLPWQIKDVWTAQLLVNSFHKTEENIKYVKINFPVETGKEWDGNAYNIYDTEMYKITGTDKGERIGQFDFDSVLTITQVNDSSLIHKDYAVEKYAKNVGLVYKYDLYIYSDLTGGYDIPIEERITKATIYKQQITNFGN